MLLSYTWLKEYLPELPTADELVAELPMHGLEVESAIDQAKGLATIVVGEVLTVSKHPQADKVQLTTVNVGQEQPLRIVCGAPNVAVGMKVPVAIIGTTLPNGMKIERRTIRGEVSEGMLCAEDELGLGESHAGLLELPREARPGQLFVAVMGLDDIVLDISIPSNRADLLSMRGIAREIGAVLDLEVRWPAEPVIKEKLGKSTWKASIDNGSGVSQLCLQVIEGIIQPPTPDYIVRRLRSSGIRSVNVIVDCANYCMIEYGQPLHTYDAELLHGRELHGRRLQLPTYLTTLDGIDRGLPVGAMVITDEDQLVSLGGVMGGKNTEVHAGTKNIVIEAAVFDGPGIRHTVRALGVASEAARRFERGLWSTAPRTALMAVRSLITSICGGTFKGGMVEAGSGARSASAISYDPTLVEQRIGVMMKSADQKSTLERFGYVVKGGKTWQVTLPSWRLDVARPEDILDDVGRVTGYQAAPVLVPPATIFPESLPPTVIVKDHIRAVLLQLGATEIILHATYGQAAVEQTGGEHLLVANPLDQTQHALRASLLPGLQRVLLSAVDAGQNAFIFEIGRVFLGQGSPDEQPWRLAIGLALRSTEHESIEWEMNGRLTALSTALRCSLPMKTPFVHTEKGRTMVIVEFDVQQLFPQNQARSMVLSVTPTIERDITVTIPSTMQYGTLEQAIRLKKYPLLQSFAPSNFYQSTQQRRITIRFVFQDPERTLTTAEVDQVEQGIKQQLQSLGLAL